MTKRSFVWFLSLIQILALSLFTEQSRASYKPEIPTNFFVQYEDSNQELLEDLEICPEECSEDSPIIMANECEWKESLTDLLRHRHSSYRFILFETAPSLFMDLIPGFKFLSKTLKQSSIYLDITVLPDYYNFLHRFCPF